MSGADVGSAVHGDVGSTKDPEQCPNCGADAPSRFCPKCGQDQDDPRRSVGAWLARILRDELSLEGRLAGTLAKLMIRPGALTAEWIDGKRARSIPPFRTYLIASVFFFSVSFFLGIPDAERELSPGLPSVSFGNSLRNIVNAAVASRSQLILTLGALSMVPAFAVWLWIMHPKAERASVDHLVFSLHQHAALFVLVGLVWPLMFVVPAWTWLVVMGIATTHAFLAYRRVYRRRRWVLRGLLSAGGWTGMLLAMATAIIGLILEPLALAPQETVKRDAAARFYFYARMSSEAEADTAIENSFARAALDEFLRVRHDFFLPHDSVHLAELMVDFSTIEEATPWVERLVADYPDDYTVQGTALRLALRQGDTIAARRHAEQLVSMEPRNLEAIDVTAIGRMRNLHQRRARVYQAEADALLGSSRF